jgi:hypothetical protein
MDIFEEDFEFSFRNLSLSKINDNKLRKELEPNTTKADEIVLEVVELITQYDDACDNGNIKKQKLAIEKIANLTQKVISEKDISEYWGYIGKEDLAYQFAIPNPLKQNISKSELIELIKKVTLSKEKTFEFYKILLEKSFPNSSPIQLIFNSDGISNDEIVEQIMKQNYQ